MRERVGHLGGTFRITSRPGAGTRIVVTVPAEPVESAKLASA
jgi:signal transduction histidine kinase